MSFFNELQQNRRINEAGLTASRTARRTDNLETDLEEMAARIESLTLVCEAMWEILKTRADLPEKLLEEKLAETKARKVSSGNVTTKAQCQACSRPLNTTHDGRCIYCGHLNKPSNIFDAI